MNTAGPGTTIPAKCCSMISDVSRKKHIVTAVAHAIIGVGRVVLMELEPTFRPEHGGTDGTADVQEKPGRHAVGSDRDHARPRFPAAPDDPGLPHLVEHATGVKSGSVCGNEYQDHPRTQTRHTQARHRRFPSVRGGPSRQTRLRPRDTSPRVMANLVGDEQQIAFSASFDRLGLYHPSGPRACIRSSWIGTEGFGLRMEIRLQSAPGPAHCHVVPTLPQLAVDTMVPPSMNQVATLPVLSSHRISRKPSPL